MYVHGGSPRAAAQGITLSDQSTTRYLDRKLTLSLTLTAYGYSSPLSVFRVCHLLPRNSPPEHKQNGASSAPKRCQADL
jgi:hypothetical protein